MNYKRRIGRVLKALYHRNLTRSSTKISMLYTTQPKMVNFVVYGKSGRKYLEPNKCINIY
jgi:hypothetical protein